MSATTAEIYFWQTIVSPHMLGLAEALAARKYTVKYVAQQPITLDRVALGWKVPSSNSVDIVNASSAGAMHRVAMDADRSSIHISQGLRGNGMISVAQSVLRKRRARHWIVMETVDERGWRGMLKRLEYRRLFLRERRGNEGVLAVGDDTPGWALARGAAPGSVFPFAYFLPEQRTTVNSATSSRNARPFQFIFVGQFIELKRLDLLIRVLSGLVAEPFELVVVGSGPLHDSLRHQAEVHLPGKVRWIGLLPSKDVPQQLAEADCLVLPSRYDGWGAVVSEAMMVGTPVVCSDACGAAGAVRSSGAGGVFDRDDIDGLASLLRSQMTMGPVHIERRRALASWAHCLGADAGAEYLLRILAFAEGNGPRPVPPWRERKAVACVA